MKSEQASFQAQNETTITVISSELPAIYFQLEANQGLMRETM